MRHSPHHAVTDPAIVRRMIRENPWATFVSHHDGLVASHYPILLDEESEELAIYSHVGKPDEELHGLGTSELLLIVAGPHGYISPSWYVPGATPAPTWNFSVAHCYGTPQLLDPETNLAVLTRLVAHFEAPRRGPALPRPGDRRPDRARDGRHPPADQPLRLQGQDERGQGPGLPAAGDRAAPRRRPVRVPRAWPTTWSARLPAGDFDYEAGGAGYATLRRTDPRIAALVHAALGDAETVLNVGAGAAPTSRRTATWWRSSRAPRCAPSAAPRR